MNTLKFSIQPLLEWTGDQSITGPISPLEFAKEMSKQTGQKFNRLARVWFEDEKTLQSYDGDGMTGHDILILATQYSNDLCVGLWIDSGIGGTPVAMAFESDREIQITPIYQSKEYLKKLDQQELKILFDYLFAHPEELDIIPFPQQSQRA